MFTISSEEKILFLKGNKSTDDKAECLLVTIYYVLQD